jgi:hypothetical protein
MNKITISLERELQEKRKDLKRKTGLRLEALDKWIYNEGLKHISVDLFESLSQSFNPKNQ